jgi:hypothetical protein
MIRTLRAPAAAAALLLLAAAARADVTASSTFGFDGAAVPGTVTPVRIELASSEKSPITVRVEVTAARGMGGVPVDGVVYTSEVYLAPGAKKRLTVPVLPRAMGGRQWNLTLRTDRRTLLRHGTQFADGRSLTVPVGPGGAGGGATRDLEAAPPVVGVLGDANMATSWLGDASRYEDKTRNVVNRGYGTARISTAGSPVATVPQMAAVPTTAAPDLWICYEGMDALLWIDPDPDGLKDAAQLDAILEYAACGGRLVVALTPGGKIGAASPLARALPALASGHDDVAAEVILACFGGGAGSSAGKAPVPVARVGEVRGTVLAQLPDGRPLVIRRSHGLGNVVATTFDPRLLRTASEGDHARLLHLLFGHTVSSPPGDEQPSYQGMPGMEPLLNHLRKRFLSAPPLGLLVLGLVLYVAAIGPIDYFLLKRKGKLRRTVVTFPLIVVSFTLVAYGASFLLFGGTSGQARVAWIDLATSPAGDADVVRGLDLAGSYSPTGTTLEVSYDQPRAFMGAPWLASGSLYGGGEAGSLDGVVVLGADGRPAGAFDLPLRSHRTVQSRFSGDVPQSLDASIRTDKGRRSVAIHNALRLPVHDLCIVRQNASGLRAVHLHGELLAGGKIDVPLPPEGARQWQTLGPGGSLPDPFEQSAGLFGQAGYGPFGRSGGSQFVPVDDTDEQNAAARQRMAHAAMGASLGALYARGATWKTRILARQGLDVSGGVAEGRILVMGWCDADPLGGLPTSRNNRSSVVVVRRLLPAEEGK